MKYLTLVLSCMVLFQPILHSQTITDRSYTPQELSDLDGIRPLSTAVRTIDQSYEGVRGTPLLFEDWRSGKVRFVRKDSFSQLISLNFDLKENVFYYHLQSGLINPISGDDVAEIVVVPEDGKKGLVMRRIPRHEVEGKKKAEEKLYVVIHEGKIATLLSYRFKEFRKAKYNQPYSSNVKYDEFVDQNIYWLKVGNGDFVKLGVNSIRELKLDKALSRYYGTAERIRKAEQLDLSEIEDLIQLLDLLEEAKKD